MIVVAFILLATGLAAIAAILRNEQLDRRKHRRWMQVQTAANERRDDDFAWATYRLEALQVAMVITCRRYEARLEAFVNTNSSRFPTYDFLDHEGKKLMRDAERAFQMLETALAPGERPRLEVVTS